MLEMRSFALAKRIVGTVVLSVLAVLPCEATPKTSKPSHATTIASNEANEFDISSRELPKGFAGARIQAVLSKFKLPPKGEFETTAEFEARSRLLTAGLYAFVIPNRMLTLTYDADNENLFIRINDIYVAVEFTKDSTHSAIELDRANERTRKYLATNAFGASLPVTEYRYDSYSIITDVSTFPDFNLSIDRDHAQVLKPKLRVVAIVGLGPESVIEVTRSELQGATGFRHKAPTMEDPEETTIFDHSLRSQLLAFWLFDDATGRVIGRYDAKGVAFGMVEYR